MPVLYELPPFLNGTLDRETYVRWLQRKAVAHVRRDRRRWSNEASVAAYKRAIHDAVLRSQGRDFYTGERLDWSLLSQYDNDASRDGRVAYKKRFALLPTVDHVDPDSQSIDFEICGWRTNDCKNDLTLAELKAFCRRILEGGR